MKIRLTRFLAVLLTVTMTLSGNANTVFALETDAGSTDVITAQMVDATAPSEDQYVSEDITYDLDPPVETGSVAMGSDQGYAGNETADDPESDLTGSVPAESAQDEPETAAEDTFGSGSDESETALQESDEPDPDELSAIDEDCTDISLGETGHIPMPGVYDTPVIDDDIDYNTIKEALIDGDEPCDDELMGVAEQAIGATVTDRAFPYSYLDEDDIISYLTKYYPNPKDQKNTGTCWAHSAIAMAEFYMISHGMKDKSVDFSELHLDYWTFTQGTPSIAGDTGDYIRLYSSPAYNVGGNSYFAARTLMQRRGVAAESKYRFEWTAEADESADPVAYINNKMSPTDQSERDNVAYLKNTYRISRDNRQLIKDAILKNGIVGVGVYIQDSIGEFYYNPQTVACYCPYFDDEHWPNHDVAIVGWDDDYPKENFDSDDTYHGKYHLKPSHNGAWLIRNSWSDKAEISIKSYFWLSYEDQALEDVCVYEMMDTTDPDFDNIYYYDSQISDIAIFYDTTKSANVYTANSGSDHETIQAVTMDLSWRDLTNINYTIDIYTGLDPVTDPESGTHHTEATTTGTAVLGGFYTIPLSNPVTVAKGESYSVVITLSDKTSVNVERFLDWSEFEHRVGVGPGQSFILQNGQWNDLYDIYSKEENSSDGNLIIHALTSNGSGGGSVTIEGADVTTDGKKQLIFDTGHRVGNSIDLSVDAKAGDETDISDKVLWHSDDRMVATVENGRVTAVGNGETKIYAYIGSPDNAKLRDECTVRVNLTEFPVTFDAGGGSFKMTNEKGEVKYSDTKIKKVCNGGTVFIEEPKMANYKFDGWMNTNGGGEFIPGETTVMRDMSVVATWTPAYKCEAPTISPASGTELHKGDQIVLSVPGTKDAQIYYMIYESATVNDSRNPKDHGSHYAEPIIVNRNADYITIRAIAVKADHTESDITTATYTVTRDIASEWGDIIDADKNDSQTGTDGMGGPVKIPDGLWVAEASYARSVAYTGSNITFPDLRVYHGNKLLQENVDYTVSYSNNKNNSEGAAAAKKPTITVKGKGNYTGQDKKTFEITKVSIASDNADITAAAITESATGKAIKPVPVIYYTLADGTGIQLKNNTDFSCAYTDSDFTTPGDHTIKVTGKGNFTGERDIPLTITEKAETTSIAKATLKGFQAKILMDPNPAITEYKQPVDSLELIVNKQKVDSDCYIISYKNNTQAGTATFTATGIPEKGYSGSISKTFKIEQIPFNAANIKVVSGFNDKITWNSTFATAGSVLQHPELKYADTVLSEGTDYELSYKNNNKAGNATMTMTGKGIFKGSFSKTFKIEAFSIQNNQIRITETSTDGTKTRGYNATEFDSCRLEYPACRTSFGAKPRLTVSFNGNQLTEGADYTLTLKNNKNYYGIFMDPDRYFFYYGYFYWPKVTITGKGAYKGSLTAYFDMEPHPDLSKAVVTAPDIVRNTKKSKSLFSTPVVTLDGVKLKAGNDYDKYCLYRYAVDTELSNGAVRKAGTEVLATDILKEGTTTWINVTVRNAGQTKATGIYAVKAGSVAKATVKINGGKPYEYIGKPVCPTKADLTVTIGKNNLNPSDYDIVSYSGNEKTGTAKLTIRGKGDYCGEKTQTFTIRQRKLLWWTGE
ncbi:MAG: Ig-like domain-containing protein [Lachnospiraceae bacterium]|nr:Ig-like domain-containing protein [Lachnospiraceae bacterium]